MKLPNFVSRLKELNAYLAEFSPNAPGQHAEPLSKDEIMYVIYSMFTIWKYAMIEQGFNYANFAIKEMTNFFETGVKNVELGENKKNL